MQSTLDEPGTEDWRKIAPMLDDAVAGLREKDRQAIVLRFYEGRSLREVGRALGTSEDAAEKRVHRALERLQNLFRKRGLASTTVVIAGAISAHSIQAAPMGLAGSVTTAVVAKGATAASTVTLVNGVLKVMAWAHVKSAVTVGAAIVLAAGTATVMVEAIHAHYESIDSKIARLNRPGTTADDAIRVLGKPATYGDGTNLFDPAHLPESYNLFYTNGVEVWVFQGKVRELQSLRPGPGFRFHGRLHLKSTLADVLDEVGPPVRTISDSPGAPILGNGLGGEPNVFYRNIDGIDGYGYYWCAYQHVRFLFRNDLVIAMMMDVPNGTN